MTYKLDHWNNPRASIATKYQLNDAAYFSRGANIAIYIMKQFDIKPSEAAKMTVLDYGCGTGRGAAFCSLLFGTTYGYDPNTYCIAEADKENAKTDINYQNLYFTTKIEDVPECDIAFSTNVIEHLDIKEQLIMIENLKAKVKGKTLLWYSPERNPTLKDYIVDVDWEQNKGGKIQIAFFDFRK